MNWGILFTKKEISAPVRDSYCRLPTMTQYSLASSRVVPLNRVSGDIRHIGVETVFGVCQLGAM